MTNLGGPGFFVLVYGLFMTAGSPILVLAWLLVARSFSMRVERAFLLIHAGIFVVGLVMATLWSMPLVLSEFTPDSLQYILLYVAMAIGVIALLEAFPLGLGILATERYADAPRRGAAWASAGGWFVGSLVGIGVVALVAPGFLALFGAVPGGIAGAVLGGPLLYSRFGRGPASGRAGPRTA